MSLVERVARAIATANGDNFADAFTNKSRWIAKRGMSGGRYRDVNEPFQDDYREMATAAIKAMSDPTEAMTEAGEDVISYNADDIIRNRADIVWQAMIAAALAPQPHTAPIPHEVAPQCLGEIAPE